MRSIANRRLVHRVITRGVQRTRSLATWIRVLAEDARPDTARPVALLRAAITMVALAGAAACDRVADAAQSPEPRP